MNVSAIGSSAAIGSSQPPPTPQQASDRRELIKATNIVNANQALGSNSELVFLMDNGGHRAIMRVIDRETKEVIMQLPPDYVLKLAKDLVGAI